MTRCPLEPCDGGGHGAAGPQSTGALEGPQGERQAASKACSVRTFVLTVLSSSLQWKTVACTYLFSSAFSLKFI